MFTDRLNSNYSISQESEIFHNSANDLEKKKNPLLANGIACSVNCQYFQLAVFCVWLKKPTPYPCVKDG